MNYCETCEFFESRQTGRPRAKGYCHCYPTRTQTDSAYWCGQYSAADSQEASKPVKAAGFVERGQLRQRLKELGVNPPSNWTNDQMRKEIQDAENKTTETNNGEGQA